MDSLLNAKVECLVANLYAVRTEVDGMNAKNYIAILDKTYVPYKEEDFQKKANELHAIAELLDTIWRE